MAINKKFKANSLYVLAEKYRQELTDESEIEKNDVTILLENEEEEMIKNGEIIIEQINAKMRLGKSTMAIARAVRIFELLKKYNKRKQTDFFSMQNIARDDQEFAKIMRNPKTFNTIIVTDESNELEKTGENSSIESAMKKSYE